MITKQPKNKLQPAESLLAIGMQIRAHRKQLKITVIAAAEAAGISRITLHRIERGEPSVAVGAYMNVMQVLNLVFDIRDANAEINTATVSLPVGSIPTSVHIKDYPQLKRLAWHVHGVDYLTPKEALGIYERNWRHMDISVLEPAEQQLIDGLKLVFAKDFEHV